MAKGASGSVDPTSGLPNRRAFLRRFAAGGREDRGQRVVLLATLAEAPAFNALLRALGHARSEAFVRAGAARLADLLGGEADLFHVSVLSFACVLPAPEGDAPPAAVARVRAGFERPILCDDIPIDARLGLGLARLGATPAEDLRAALAAAQDSRSRLEGWAWYDPTSDAAHRRAFRLLTDLQAALGREGDLSLAFQPKVALADGTPRGVEALLRWTHPELGAISPGEFVPLAETTALLAPLTRRVVSAAVAQLAAWDRAGIDLPVAVNVSPKNLAEPDFVEFMLFACAAARVDRSRLELEVTEGLDAGRAGPALERLRALAKLGFPIAIDDFGAGYSNMGYLARLPARTLKLDRSLVGGVVEGTPEGRLLAGVVALGRDLGFRIVAEGVETEAERALLARLGCDYGQGWLFARPMPAAAVEDWAAMRAEPMLRRA